MKENELMIGDWVNIYTFPNDVHKQKDLYPAIITSITVGAPDESLNNCEGIIPKSEGGYGVFARPIDTIFPIPLTAEILEKNGFTHSFGDSDFYDYEKWEKKVDDKTIRVIKDHNGWFCRVDDSELTRSMGIAPSVHTMQHIIRIGGVEQKIEL